MDPFTLGAGLLGAGGSIASAIMGADASSDNAMMNWYINERNLRAQKQQQQDARDYADKIRTEQQLGATDATGNRTHFVPGKGWVTELSPDQQALYDYFFKQELPERRGQFEREAQASRDNSDQANQLLDQFTRVRRQLPQEAADQLYEAATRGIGEGARDVTETAMRQGLRTGNSSIADILGKIGAQTMKARGDARKDSQIQARDYVDQKFQSQRGGLAQLYNMFLSQAGKPLQASYDPTGITSGANSLMNVFSNQAQQGNSMGMNSMMQPAPQMKPMQMDNGAANAAGAIGSALSGLGDRLGGMNQKSQMNDLLKQYISQGGQLNFANGGIMNNMTDRLRTNTQVY